MKSEKVPFSYFLGKQWTNFLQRNYAAYQSEQSLNHRVKIKKWSQTNTGYLLKTIVMVYVLPDYYGPDPSSWVKTQ